MILNLPLFQWRPTGGGRMSLIIVFLQFSIKFYFSGCLVLITNSKLMIFVGKRRGFPILANCGFRIVRKKKHYHIPDAITEQMGYGSVSFFVYTKSTNQSLADKDMLLLPDSIQNTSPDVIFYTLFAYRAIR